MLLYRSLGAVCCALLSLPVGAVGERPDVQGDMRTVAGGPCEVGFSADHGVILFIRDRSGSAPDRSLAAASDLWSLRLRNGSVIRSRDVSCHAERIGADELRLSYEVDGGAVVVRAAGSPNGVDLSARIDGLKDDVLDVSLPPDLSFDPAHLQRILFPSYLGVALKPPFFRAKTEPTAWQAGAVVGPEELRRVAGLDCANGS